MPPAIIAYARKTRGTGEAFEHFPLEGEKRGQDGEWKLGQLRETLPVDARVKRYRQFAKDAFRQAHETCDEEKRASYLTMAAAWHSLAEETGRARDEDGAGALPH